MRCMRPRMWFGRMRRTALCLWRTGRPIISFVRPLKLIEADARHRTLLLRGGSCGAPDLVKLIALWDHQFIDRFRLLGLNGGSRREPRDRISTPARSIGVEASIRELKASKSGCGTACGARGEEGPDFLALCQPGPTIGNRSTPPPPEAL